VGARGGIPGNAAERERLVEAKMILPGRDSGRFLSEYHRYKNSFPVYALAALPAIRGSARKNIAHASFLPGEFRLRSGLYTKRERSAS